MSDLFDVLRAYPTVLQACGVVGSVLYVGGFGVFAPPRTHAGRNRHHSDNRE